MKRNYFLLGALAGLVYGYVRHPCGCLVLLAVGAILVIGVVIALLHSVEGIALLALVGLLGTGMALLSGRTRS